MRHYASDCRSGFDFACVVYPHLGARVTEEGVMQWFTVAWWRWRLAQVRGRNPLVRTSDRIEVAVMSLAIVASLAVVPFAGAIGTAIHDEHAQRYAVERQERHLVVAAVGFWLSATAVAALLVAVVRWGLNHTRYAGWHRDMASLVHDDGGRTNRRW
jgi:hypothetical protein